MSEYCYNKFNGILLRVLCGVLIWNFTQQLIQMKYTLALVALLPAFHGAFLGLTIVSRRLVSFNGSYQRCRPQIRGGCDGDDHDHSCDSVDFCEVFTPNMDN